MLAGTLEIQMVADLARIQKDMEQVKGVVSGAMADVEKYVDLAKKALIGFVGVASVQAFAGMIKGAIDSTAALHDMSQATGMSAAALGQFKSIGAFTETSLDAITGASVKLSKAMATQDEDAKGAATALKALGINYDDFRKLKPEEQMIEVARSMGQFADGADKTAAATLLFGKSGAALLPFLADLGDSADKVSAKLTDQEVETRRLQAAMADAFGDNLVQIRKDSEGWKKDMAMGLLPAMHEAVQAFMDMGGGAGGLKAKISELAKDGTLADWARGAITALTYLIDVAQGLFTLIPMLGKAIAGVAAGASALFGGIFEAMNRLKSGDITGAWESLKGGFEGVKTIGEETANDIGKLWGQELLGAKFRDRMQDLKGVQAEAKEAKKQLDLQSVLKANEAAKARDAAATKAAAEETKKLISAWEAAEKAGEDLMRATALKNAELQKELDIGRQLTPLEKDLAKFEADMAAGKVIMSEADAEATRQLMKLNDQLRQEYDWLAETTKANQAAKDAQDKSTDAVRQAVEKQLEANTVFGLGTQALHAHEQQLIDDKVATLRAKAATMELVDIDMAAKLRAEATEWERLKTLKEDAFNAKAAQDFLNSAQQTFESTASGFADAMMGGIDGVKDYLKRTLEHTLIKVPLQMVAQGLAGDATNALAGALGISQPGGAKSGIGDLLSGGKDIYNMLAGGGAGTTILGGLGGNVLTGGAGLNVGAGLGIEGVGASFGAEFGGAAFGAEALGGTAAAAGGSLIATLSAAAPYVAGALALVSLGKKLFGGGHAPHYGGYALGGADGSVTDVTALQGGKQDAGMQEVVGSLVHVSSALLNTFAETFGAQGGFSVRAGAEFNGKDAGWGFLKIIQDGFEKFGFDAKGTLAATGQEGFGQFTAQTAASLREVLVGMDVPQWAKDVLASIGESPSMENLVAAVQRITAMTTALNDMTDAVAPLGGVFAKLGGLTSDAKMQLAEFTGGIEQFLAKTASYVQNYFTDEEQAAIQAQSIMRTLSAVGLDGTQLTQKGDLRRLMDSLNPADEAQRKQIAALLNINAEFAQLSKYLETSGLSLAALAQLMPGSAAAQALADGAGTDTATTAAQDQATATKELATTTDKVATNTETTAAAVTTVAQQQADALPKMLEALIDIASRVAAIETVIEREGAKPTKPVMKVPG